MKKHYKSRIAVMACFVVLLFAVTVGFGLHFSSSYIEKQLLQANQDDVVDIATIVGNNFSLSDAEVDYMKSLTFQEMEADPVNRRMMDIVSGISLNNKISNVYIMALLPDDEVKYTVDESNAEALGFKAGTRLNGIWLLNGSFDESGRFQTTNREDIYRYLEFCKSDQKIFDSRKSFGLVSEDVWGKFITGYVPFYSSEGTYVGILGVDMDMNRYNANVSKMTATLIAVFCSIVFVLILLLLLFFAKYQKTKEGVLYYEFYSRLSHDLRTPMNGILGVAHLSKDEENPAVLHEDISKMEHSGQYLLALINDTLDFQKLHSKKLTLHKEIINIKEQFDDIVHMISETAKQKGVRFETNVSFAELEEFVLADAIRLKQILINLLSNAVKFTPRGGTVTWRLQLLSRAKNTEHCLLTIQDTGIGMSEKFLKHEIFKPSSQEYNTTTAQYSGSGLGLSIVKSLVEQMGGRIEVESRQGEGTTFRVYLDFEEVDAEKAKKALHASAGKEEHAHATLKGKRILLAEDHPLNAEIAKKLLQKAGCEVIWAKNGQEAVSAFAQATDKRLDAVLMDIRMPVMDGIEATRQIRALNTANAKTIPIIALTANAYEDDIKHCMEAGMNAHLIKPIEPAVLYETIGKSLRGADGRRQE